MSLTVSIGEAKTHLSELIERAETGENVIITRDGVPVARIAPVERPISKTIALMRRECERRPRVSAADICAAKEQGRA